MADTRMGIGLQTIFGLFLGLMVMAFVGVGVYTFYPSPEIQFRDRIERLNREEQAVRNSKAPAALTAEDRASLQKSTDELNSVQDASRQARESWGRRTSMILVAFATLVLVLSLVRAAQLPVISNGLLLGGVFTMLYGVGWIIGADASKARFAVMSVALVITLALGYVRFVRQRTPALAPEADRAERGAALGDLELRVRELEERMDEAANAMMRQRHS